jgi:hypothetical protein
VAKKKQDDNKTEVVGFLGVGLDNQDGHHRVTQSDNFLLVGGSSDTHERMQDVAIYFDESLESKGKRLEDAEAQEILDLLRDALDH